MSQIKSAILILCFVLTYYGLDASNKSAIYTAFIKNDFRVWKAEIDRIQRIKNKSNNQMLELINYQYGYIGWCLELKKEKEARKYLDLLTNNNRILERWNYKPGLVNAYKAAIYGFHVRLDRMKAPYYGPLSVNYLNKAMDLDANNWFIHILEGNTRYYMPTIFGGSKSEALKSFLKAKNLMEENITLISDNWNYMNLLISIAKSYTELGNFLMAEKYYQKIIRIEPNILLAKNKLEPKLKK